MNAIDLGLAVSALSLQYGEYRTLRDLACYMDAAKEVTGCKGAITSQSLSLIEQRALRKLRHRLLFMKDPVLQEAIQTLFKR